jgi:hypothetical protein
MAGIQYVCSNLLVLMAGIQYVCSNLLALTAGIQYVCSNLLLCVARARGRKWRSLSQRIFGCTFSECLSINEFFRFVVVSTV